MKINGTADFYIEAKERATLITILRKVKSHYGRMGGYDPENYHLDGINKTLTLKNVHTAVVDRACDGLRCKKTQL